MILTMKFDKVGLGPGDEVTREMFNIKKGDIICYRPNLVTVLEVKDEGVEIEDPYGVTQTIDWEDVLMYNQALYIGQ